MISQFRTVSPWLRVSQSRIPTRYLGESSAVSTVSESRSVLGGSQ